MIYLDASVMLAHLFDERRRPAPDFWLQEIRSSTLLEYEVWNRVHAYGHAEAVGSEVGRVFSGVSFVELTPPALSRALRPFPSPLRTPDALHLATMVYLRGRGARVELASYDARLVAAAEALSFGVVAL